MFGRSKDVLHTTDETSYFSTFHNPEVRFERVDVQRFADLGVDDVSQERSLSYHGSCAGAGVLGKCHAALTSANHTCRKSYGFS